MKNNPYFDFERLTQVVDPEVSMTDKQLKGESGFIYLMAQIFPFYLSPEEEALQNLAILFKQTKPSLSVSRRLVSRDESNLLCFTTWPVRRAIGRG